MRINYHKDTDSLYIHLNDVPTDESEELAEDTIIHFAHDGAITSIEILSEASEKVEGIYRLAGVVTLEVNDDDTEIDSDSHEIVEFGFRGVRGRHVIQMIPKQ